MTGSGKPVSFEVSAGGVAWSGFRLAAAYSTGSCGPGAISGTTEVGVEGPGAIAAGSCGHTGATFSFQGTFDSSRTAGGSYSFTNYPLVANLPYPPYVCVFYFNQQGTWTAAPE